MYVGIEYNTPVHVGNTTHTCMWVTQHTRTLHIFWSGQGKCFVFLAQRPVFAKVQMQIKLGAEMQTLKRGTETTAERLYLRGFLKQQLLPL